MKFLKWIKPRDRWGEMEEQGVRGRGEGGSMTKKEWKERVSIKF